VKLFLRSYSNAVCCETPPTLEGMYQLQALESIPILGPPAGRGRAGFPSFWLPVPHTVQSDSVLTTDQTSRLNLNEFMTDMSTNAISRLRALATLDKTLKPMWDPKGRWDTFLSGVQTTLSSDAIASRMQIEPDPETDTDSDDGL
jgi:hypothetical protein